MGGPYVDDFFSHDKCLHLIAAHILMVVNRAPEGRFRKGPPAEVPHFTNKGHIAIDACLKAFLDEMGCPNMELVKIFFIKGVSAD